MGIIAKQCGKIVVKGCEFDIELNEPLERPEGGKVHIQNSNMRIEMSQKDFYKMVVSFQYAVKKLYSYKKISEGVKGNG